MPTTTPSVEPENSHLRTTLRQLAVVLKAALADPRPNQPGGGDEDDRLRAAQEGIARALGVVEVALMRPRTDGHTIDALKRRIGDLESALVDQRVLKMEKAAAVFRSQEAAKETHAAFAELQQVRQSVRPRARVERPTYNHTREDDPLTPCPECAGWQQPDAKFLSELGASIRAWVEQGVLPVKARAAEIEGELLEIAAALIKRNAVEEGAVDTAADRERLLYWLCWAATLNYDTEYADRLRKVLQEFDYDEARVVQMLQLGEPGRRNKEGSDV